MQSSRRLEREAQRNVELMWLTRRLAPDHKTIADFRRENGSALQAACGQFVVLCRELGLFGAALVAFRQKLHLTCCPDSPGRLCC